MRAAVFEGPGRMVVKDVETPACDPGGILVRVKACGICGSDVRNFRTGLRNGRAGQIIGHEIAGVVEETGGESRRFAPGDRVAVAPDVSCGSCHYCARGLVNLCLNHRMVGTHWPGGFAQFLALPREVMEHGMVHPMPPGMSFPHAALAEPLSSVLAAQEAARIGKGTAVAVFGAGPVGCMHVEIARSRGASPVILVGRRRLALAAAFHPDLSLSVSGEDPVTAILRATAGLGVDVAIVAAPAPESQEQALEAVRKRGTVMLFGGLPRDNPRVTLDSNRIHYNEISLVGSFSYPARMHAEALAAIRGGRITPDSYISRIVSLDGIVDAITSCENGEVLKVIVDPWVEHERN
jgi:L-iditol 2-dehydrogenase